DLRADTLDGILLFSPRTAKTFVQLVGNAGLTLHCAKLVAFCISAATAEALGNLNFTRVAVAGAPNQDAILSLIPPLCPASERSSILRRVMGPLIALAGHRRVA